MLARFSRLGVCLEYKTTITRRFILLLLKRGHSQDPCVRLLLDISPINALMGHCTAVRCLNCGAPSSRLSLARDAGP